MMQSSGSIRKSLSVVAVVIAVLIVMSGLLLYQTQSSQEQLKEMSNLTASLQGQVNSLEDQVSDLRNSLEALSNRSNSSTSTAPVGLVLGEAYVSGSNPWTLIIPGYNGNTSAVNVTGIELDGQPYFGAVGPTGLPYVIDPGSSFAFSCNLTSSETVTYEAGQTVQITLYLSSGQSYTMSAGIPENLPYSDALIVSASVNGTFIDVYVRNLTTFSIPIAQVDLNGTELPQGVCEFTEAFVDNSLFAYQEGHIMVPVPNAIPGDTYVVTLNALDAGLFTVAVTWP